MAGKSSDPLLGTLRDLELMRVAVQQYAANGTLPAKPEELPPGLADLSPVQLADALARAQRAGTMMVASDVLVRTSPLNRPGRYLQAMLDDNDDDLWLHNAKIKEHLVLTRAVGDTTTSEVPTGSSFVDRTWYVPATGWLAEAAEVVDPATLGDKVPQIVDYGAVAVVQTTEKTDLGTDLGRVDSVTPTVATIGVAQDISAQVIYMAPVFTDQVAKAMMAGVDRKVEAWALTGLAGAQAAIPGTDPFPAMALAAAAGDAITKVAIVAGVHAAGKLVERLVLAGLAGRMFVNSLLPTDLAYVVGPSGTDVRVSPSLFLRDNVPGKVGVDLAAARVASYVRRHPDGVQVLNTAAP